MYYIRVGLTLMLSSIAFSQEVSNLNQRLVDIVATELKCFETAASSEVMIACNQLKLKDSEDLLSDVYKTRIAALKKQEAEENEYSMLTKVAEEKSRRLIVAQQTWFASRDADCAFMGAEMLGTSGEPLIVAGCLADKTFKRIKEISPATLEE